MSDLKAMMARYAVPGRVVSIFVRTERRRLPAPVDAAHLTDAGLDGDHSRPGKRALTLIQAEHVPVIAALSQTPDITAQILRRNLVVAGLNLTAFRDQSLQIGPTIVHLCVPCHPCSRMEELLGHGGYTAMRGHGGFCASVVATGAISVGDAVVPLAKSTPQTPS